MEAWRHIWDHVGRAHWMRFAPVVLVFGLVVLTCGTGLVTGLDHRLAELRFEALRRPASDTLVVVEIDAASLSQLDQWPWTRGIYADVVRQVDDAGARLIAFDVDFSARSDEAGDALLAAAIGRASGRVILPTFKQVASSQDPTRVIEATPNAQFSEHAILASVNVEPSPDGVVRRARYGFRDADGYRASVAGALSDVEYGRDDSFDIDFGIDVEAVAADHVGRRGLLALRPAHAVVGHRRQPDVGVDADLVRGVAGDHRAAPGLGHVAHEIGRAHV